jgi:hypothetical protein
MPISVHLENAVVSKILMSWHIRAAEKLPLCGMLSSKFLPPDEI